MTAWKSGAAAGVAQFLELEVDAEGIVQLSHLMSGDPADDWPQAFHGYRADLFPLCL